MPTGKEDGSWTPSDYRGGSGDVRDSYNISPGEESQAKYDKELDEESSRKEASRLDHIKRWVSQHF